MMEFHNVYKKYSELKLYQGLNLNVPANSVVSLLGPSGCGKTTLLNMAAGIEKPDSGQIVRPESMSYVFQEDRLLPWKTVLGNAVYAMEHHTQLDSDRAFHMLELLGLAEASFKYPREISGGMARRCTLARALLASFDIIFLDEPLGSLDTDLKFRILPVIKNHLAGKSAILVTHDAMVASLLADTVYRLSLPPVCLTLVEKPDLEVTLQHIEKINRQHKL